MILAKPAIIDFLMELKDIKAVVELMKKNSLSEFEMEQGDFKLRLKRDAPSKSRGGKAAEAAIVPLPAAAPVAMTAPPAAAPVVVETPLAPAVADPAPAAADGVEVKSPMIGTFYRRPSPDAEPFADVGAQVEPDTVVCIIEAMKVMNEIKAETRGVITEILAEDAKPVEYGQVLFRIEPN